MKKALRDQIHFSQTVTPKQIARMRTGRVESRPEDYAMIVSRIDMQAGVARRRAEALRDERALAKQTCNGWD